MSAPSTGPEPQALFELADVGLELTPTEAMKRGVQVVDQCAWCGTVVVWSRGAYRERLGTCPSCGCDAGGKPNGESSWWRQSLPVAGLSEHEHTWTPVGAVDLCRCTLTRPSKEHADG